ncbi:MAG: hypothetical protein JSS86_00280 [Cyanobacteria bacterium SZAS LIN-2]|nr:hypothetical protein [Cyanobacteria bacterium SZAS LIN-2]
MSAQNLRTGDVRPDETRDPRTRLAREKFFSMRPKPLERWLWQQGIPASAERVYWYHWDIGNRNGTWCSQVPIRIVGRECCLDPATVTRAYQLLKRLELIRREDPGRDPANPFQQATAVTEVRIPRELLTTLGREPSRPHAAHETRAVRSPIAMPEVTCGQGRGAADPAIAALSREESRAIFARLSTGERVRFAEASRQRRTSLEFDADTRLGPAERGHVLATLESLACARPTATATDAAPPANPRRPSGPRRLAALEIVKLQKSLRTLAAAAGMAPDASLMRQVLFAVEEGALVRFPTPLAINVALKKIREGAWSMPHRMPPDWGVSRALPESCSAAGGI